MKHLKKFDSVSAMKAAITASEITIVGLAFDGTTPVSGRKFVVTPPAPSPSTPFYIDVRGPVTLAATSGLQMSTDGKTWTDTTATTLSSGKTYFRVASDQSTPLKPNWTEDNNSDYDIGGNINSLVKVNFEEDTACYSFYISNSGFFKDKTKLKSAGDLILPATILAGSCYSSMFNGCTSLTTAPTLPATRLAARCYEDMFQRCTSLTAAPALPATRLAGRCYEYMFQNCTSLTTAPALPATTLANNCYEYMFNNCTSLTTAPELPATTLVEGCYNYMFQCCTSLTTAPALPATTLAVGCYYQMFYGCTSLTTAPELPATTLAQNCYGSMFQRCTSLTTASELPATTLVAYCYKNMFNGCTNLNYIKCLATDISATGCLNNWVSGVSSTGTFVKNPSMSSWITGTNGIPTGWIIKDGGIISLIQNLNVATITISYLDEGTGYYAINGSSHISVGNGTTTIPITQEMNGQVLLVYGEFSGEPSEKTLTLSWTDYSPSVTITKTNNYVTITSATADTVQYRLGSSGSYATYTTPVYITENTTIYVIATRTVSGVVYTTNVSEEVTHELIPPTNLVISCASNTVTITADNATTIEYNFDGSSTYTTYTKPFAITQTVTVYARATSSGGSITGSQECEYSAIPFAENLVFYAPLTEGDLTDHISEASLTNYGSNVTWDSTKGMYKFAAVTKANEMYFPVDLSTGITNNKYTIMADVQNPTFSPYNYPSLIVIGGYSDSASDADGSWRPSLSNWYKMTNNGLSRNSRMYFVYITNGTNQYNKVIYNNTVYTVTTEKTSSSAKRSSWNALMKSRVAMNPSRRDSYIYDSYIKDVRIYNFALTNAQLLEVING